jgi:hypothetical protein
MAKVTRGFTGRESRVRAAWLPPGQYDPDDVDVGRDARTPPVDLRR